MGYDPLSPVAPARVRCLLVPCGQLSRSKFLQAKERLEKESIVRLGDVSPSDGPHGHMFSPQAFPAGYVFYDMTVSETPPTQLSLAPFELYRRPLVILGIADGESLGGASVQEGQLQPAQESNGTVQVVERAQDTPLEDYVNHLSILRARYASAVTHKVLIFDCPQVPFPALQDVFLVPTREKSKPTALKTIMCDLTASFLTELGSLAQSIQAQSSIQTPAYTIGAPAEYRERPSSQGDETSRPGSRLSETPTSRSVSPAPYADRTSHRASLPAHLSSTLPQSPRGELDGYFPSRESSRGPPVTFDEMNGSFERPLSTPKLEAAPKSNRAPQLPLPSGATSLSERAKSKANGRIGVVLGSIHLLAGRWPDAVRELTDSAFLARGSNDHVWHAKALDYILVCLLLYGWAGMDFTIPSVCSPMADKGSPVPKKPSKSSKDDAPDLGALKSPPAVNRTEALQQLCDFLPDLINNILHLYVRAATFTTDRIPQLSFSETTIRLSRLSACICVSEGFLDDQCLRAVVMDIPLIRNSAAVPGNGGSLSKSDIALTLFRALPTPNMERSVEFSSLLGIYAGVVSVLSILGYQRKRAFVLKGMIDLLLPSVIQSRKDSAAGLGVHPAASLSSMDLSLFGSDSGSSLEALGGSPLGLRTMLNAMANVSGVLSADPKDRSLHVSNGVSNDAEGALHSQETASTSVNRIVGNSLKRKFGYQRLKFDILRACLQISEALPDAQGIFEYINAFLLTAGKGVAVGPRTLDPAPLMPYDDQTRMVAMMKRTAASSKTQNEIALGGSYWDDFLVRDIQVKALGSGELPSVRRRSELKTAFVADAKARGGPFIYNPFGTKPAVAAQIATLILGKKADFIITLQNLYDVDVEIDWIRIDCANAAIEAETAHLVVGPSRLQSIRILGTPKSAGEHAITGCSVKVSGCHPKRFPLFKNPWKPGEETRLKHTGLAVLSLGSTDLRSRTDDSKAVQLSKPAPEPSVLKIKIIEDQPLVILKDASIFQLSTMLLEGESRIFTVVLQNTSSSPVDFLIPTFANSTASYAQATLASKDLHPTQIYEVELEAYHHPALQRVSREGGLEIAPKGELQIEIEAYGKPGLDSGTISFEYGHIGPQSPEREDVFFTRVLNVPLSMTVNASIQLLKNEFLPFSGDIAWLNKNQKHQNNEMIRRASSQSQNHGAIDRQRRFQNLFRRLGLKDQGDKHCVLLLDFQNAWPRPLSLSLQVRSSAPKDLESDEPWERAYTVHETVQHGSVCRILVLLPRLSIENPYQAIPSVNPANKRQYVVSGSKAAPEFERATRELFWYRQEALKYLRATWEEPETGRRGDVNLRNLRLTSKMLEAIKLEDVDIEMSLGPSSGGGNADVTQQVGHTLFKASTDTSLVLKTRVTNRLKHPIQSLLRLRPSLRNQPYNIALDLAKKFAFNGLLQRRLPLIGAGEEKEVSIGIMLFCAGEFEVDATVEEIRRQHDPPKAKVSSTRTRAATGDFASSELESTERRTWHAREPCRINVHDPTDLRDMHTQP